jgi:hypothetical protein
MELNEISEKVQKSLMTPIMSRLHRLEMHCKYRKIRVIFFEIYVIRRAQSSLSGLS